MVVKYVLLYYERKYFYSEFPRTETRTRKNQPNVRSVALQLHSTHHDVSPADVHLEDQRLLRLEEDDRAGGAVAVERLEVRGGGDSERGGTQGQGLVRQVEAGARVRVLLTAGGVDQVDLPDVVLLAVRDTCGHRRSVRPGLGCCQISLKEVSK